MEVYGEKLKKNYQKLKINKIMDKKKTAYQDIVDKIHYYIKNPHKNPYDVINYEGDEVEIIND